MKTFMRCILIGVCVLIVGFPLKAEVNPVKEVEYCVPHNNKSVDLRPYIEYELFSSFRENDSISILEKGAADTLGYSVSYQIEDFQFSGDYVSTEGRVTVTGYKNQYILCTVFYTRTIQFNFGEPFFKSDTEDSDSITYWRQELFGLKENGYPQAQVKSVRSWQCVVCIKKPLLSNGTFSIEGDTCLEETVKLKVPEQYADMQCTWSCDETRYVSISNKYAHEITVSRKNIPFLTTDIRCTLRGCDDTTKISSSIRLRLNKTPVSELTFDDCLSTARKSIQVTASNVAPNVRFLWNGKALTPLSSNAFSQTVRYPVSGSDNFSIVLETFGGCSSSQTTKIVHRELADNVSLQVLDSCLTAGIPFHMATEPPLPNMDLQWMTSSDFLIAPINLNSRKDRATIMKKDTSAQTTLIRVRDQVCNGSVSEFISVSEAYTDMEARAIGNKYNVLLNEQDSVPPESTIVFTAPTHSSISGYTWSVVYEDGRPAQLMKGDKTLTIKAPIRGYSFRVTVSYRSCFGSQSKTYRLKSMDNFAQLLSE